MIKTNTKFSTYNEGKNKDALRINEQNNMIKCKNVWIFTF